MLWMDPGIGDRHVAETDRAVILFKFNNDFTGISTLIPDIKGLSLPLGCRVQFGLFTGSRRKKRLAVALFSL